MYDNTCTKKHVECLYELHTLQGRSQDLGGGIFTLK